MRERKYINMQERENEREIMCVCVCEKLLNEELWFLHTALTFNVLFQCKKLKVNPLFIQTEQDRQKDRQTDKSLTTCSPFWEHKN